MARLPGALLLALLLLNATWHCAAASQDAVAGGQELGCGEGGCQRHHVRRPAHEGATAAQPTVHTVIATDCSRYFTW